MFSQELIIDADKAELFDVAATLAFLRLDCCHMLCRTRKVSAPTLHTPDRRLLGPPSGAFHCFRVSQRRARVDADSDSPEADFDALTKKCAPECAYVIWRWLTERRCDYRPWPDLPAVVF
jgi:hypothetical protein